MNELIDIPEVDYNRDSDLLFKVANQAIEKFRSLYEEEKVINIVQYRKRDISNFINSQLMEHFFYESLGFEQTNVYPFDKIREHNFTYYTEDRIYDFRETIEPTNKIPSKIFTGFLKACHREYKFDSKTEKDFSIILEDDSNVLKWLRPAQNQFNIRWKAQNKSGRYEPDFVVETNNCIYMVETKKESEIPSVEVQAKAKAALEYCKHVTEHNVQHNSKPWKYVVIPHNAVLAQMGFDYLVQSYEFKEAVL